MISLDETQSLVAGADASRWCVVIAGPGSGKTTVSVSLISHLDKVVPDPEHRTVLYISFSRATIKAAFAGAKQVAEESDLFVDLRTIDSLALYLLNEFSFEHAQSGGDPNFERRIVAATGLVQEQGEELLDDICHVIVDEAQDLSASRRDFLIELLKKVPADCGLTLFADPAQAIYQFQDSTSRKSGVKDQQSSFTDSWKEFLKEISSIRPTDRVTLDGQYRSRTPAMRSISRRLSASRDADGLITDSLLLDEIQSELPVLTLEGVPEVSKSWRGTTAILTSTNAEALQIFAWLRGRSPVRIILPRQDRPRLPAWLAYWESHPNASGDTFSVQDLFSQSSTIRGFSEDEARQLGLTIEDYGEVRWSDIPKRSENFTSPPVDSLSEQDLVVSTIHQAKGLEYDNVLIYNPESLISPPTHQSARLEMLFVALSRASSRLVSLEKSDDVRPTRIVKGRPIVPHHHRVSPAYVKVGPADIRNDILIGAKAAQAQLRDHGDSKWVHFEIMDGSPDVPIYRILLDGTPVGMTTNDFGAEIKSLTRSSRGRWPSLGPVQIDGVESAVSYRWNRGRPFLIPRPLGFASISYPTKKD